MFVAALFTIAKTWKQPKCPSTNEWLRYGVRACRLSHFSCVKLLAILWTIVCQAPLSMGFFRQEYWSGLPCPPPGNLSNPGLEPKSPVSPVLQADSLPTEPPRY